MPYESFEYAQKTSRYGIENKTKTFKNVLRTKFQKILCLNFRSSPPEVLLGKGVLKIDIQQIYRRTLMPKCDFNKVANNIIEITVRHGCSLENLMHFFRTSFSKKTSR